MSSVNIARDDATIHALASACVSQAHWSIDSNYPETTD